MTSTVDLLQDSLSTEIIHYQTLTYSTDGN